MSNILEEIAEKTRFRVAAEEAEVSVSMLQEKIKSRNKPVDETEGAMRLPLEPGCGRFYQALKKDGMSYICEVKKASPSKGLIAPDFPYLDIAKEYENAKASAISCLTEPEYFLGSNRYLDEITDAVKIPVLKKDFTVNEYMVYQAAAYGASAILLICAILNDDELRNYRELAERLGLDALVEAHDEEEIRRAILSGAHIIGVNNRNLKNFTVDTGNASSLRGLVPDDIVFVSESGIQTADDISGLRAAKVDAVLIGETLMRASDKSEKLLELNGGPVI